MQRVFNEDKLREGEKESYTNTLHGRKGPELK
jgi:hypothetical protein